VLSRNVSVYNTDGSMMERTNNVIYRPQPYIAQSYDGMDQTGNFTAYTQLSVPATLGFQKSVPFILDALELRDALQEGRLGEAAKQKLASDINIAIMNVAAAQGSLVVTVNTAAGDYDDIALCDSIMNEQGVQAFDRYMALSSATTTAGWQHRWWRWWCICVSQLCWQQVEQRVRALVRRHGCRLRHLQAGLRKPLDWLRTGADPR
jgi:hypothetical protein